MVSGWIKALNSIVHFDNLPYDLLNQGAEMTIQAEILTMSQDFLQSETLKILVINDHELILNGTIDLLKQHYFHSDPLQRVPTDS